ncbi:MAG: nitrate reductase, partial [Alphaproteobacteria bacterium]
QHGPDSVAFYVSGQILTEDYYVANKLMKGFIGSANIDTNSRLCMASSVAGHRRAFGGDVVPGLYEDFDQADVIVLVGSNAAFCHPVLFRRMLAARQTRGTRLVVIDPRRTATAAEADLHLPLASGSDALLFNGLLVHLAQHNHLDGAWTTRHLDGFDQALCTARATAGSLEVVAAGTGLPVADILRFYRMVAGQERWVTAYSQGVNQSATGTDKVNAILTCHLATGRIGRPGMGPFSLTGQPNAMGGREVGGLANQLAAHMALEDASARERVQRFWASPTIASKPGLKAVDLFQAVAAGQIKALWIMGTNPAVSLPDAGAVRAALAACPFVVVADCMADTDTTRFAHVRLPALAWGEKTGTVTNSERRISRQRAFLPAPGEARADWWMLADLGRRLGWPAAFAWTNAAGVFREHAALSGFENQGSRAFDIGALATLNDGEYDGLAPTLWPHPVGRPAAARLFGDGQFVTPNRRARTPAIQPCSPTHGVTTARPLVLNTGRLRDQWHTMTRTGSVTRLAAQHPESTAALAPETVRSLGLQPGDLVQIASDWGSIVLPVQGNAGVQPNHVFVPIHWTDQFTGAGVVGRVVNPVTDPISGQPEAKHTPVSLTAIDLPWRGVVLARTPLAVAADYWSRRPVEGGWSHRLAWEGAVAAPITALAGQLDAEVVSLVDSGRTRFRWALFRDGAVVAVMIAGAAPHWPDLADATRLFLSKPVEHRHAVLAIDARPCEPVVCACLGVRRDRIEAAIRAGAGDVAALGAACGAGSRCGSCQSELRGIIADVAPAAEPVPA